MLMEPRSGSEGCGGVLMAEGAASAAIAAEAGGVSPIQFRDALSRIGTAVSVVSTDGPAGMAGLTCSAVCAVCDRPPLVAVCVHRDSAANAAISINRVLCVNCLHSAQQDLSQMFAGVGQVTMPERFRRGRWSRLATGAPVCDSALVALDCEVIDVRQFGTHSMFIARVVATANARVAEPLLYHQRSYATTRSV